ncbi:polyprenyl diphosphate synthase [Bombella sp. TMW 2.2543]|uniref:Isoprenyl transferase n=1 Tax=Bombella pluederhausensis TaxID=2967336 RepID=A0ABT3WHU9_9PROT|nr:polyprenyl diphosphate synthase [Bombella pluederhausensis]MCX5617387.1 polyprenyl diphosphate synthase [Bombella pluederhausensis]
MPPEALPRHVAVIMDGNGRWAQARGVPVVQGHREGGEAVQRCVRAAIEHGITYLTLYAFSSENWRRSGEEISDLTGLMQFYLRHRLKELDEQGVRLRIIGEPERFGASFCRELRRAEEKTRGNTRLVLSLALSYGSRAEIAGSARILAERVRAGTLAPQDIDEDMFASALQTHDVPDPDLVMRTSGESRLSNFLLWQSAYAELIFLDVLWPDFSEKDFAEAIQRYMRRQRRFGGRPE